MEQIEQNNNSEEEARVLDFINLAILKRKGRETLEISELVDELTEGLPDELKIKIESYYNTAVEDSQRIVKDVFEEMPSLEVEGMETEEVAELKERMETYHKEKEGNIEKDFKLKDRVKTRGREVREGFMDENLKIPNKAYSKLDLISKIDEVLENEPTVEGLKKVAYVSFDLNGLKAVNDLNGGAHAFGDEYLRLAVEAIGSDEARAIAKENGLDSDYIVTRNGGDEFGVMLKSGEPIEADALNNFTWKVQDILWENDKVSNALDFNNPNVLVNFEGVDIKEFNELIVVDKSKTKEENLQDAVDKFKDEHDIPRDYKYKGAISVGVSRLYDALIDEENKEKNGVEGKDSYERIVKKVMGSTLGTGDRRMDVNKKIYKKGLADGENAFVFINETEAEKKKMIRDAIMLSRIYTRTDAEKDLLEENHDLKVENKKLREEDALGKNKEEQLASDILAFIEAGGSAVGVMQMLEKRKLK